MSYYTPPSSNNNNFLTKFSNFFGNIFNPTPKTAQQPTTNVFNAPQPANVFNNPTTYAPFQIQNGSTFDSIAAQTGVTVPQIQAANNNMVVPPPKGSYIQIPQAGTGIPIPGVNTPAQNAALTFNNPHMNRVFPNTTQPPAATNKADYTDILQSQVLAGNPPKSVPAGVVITNPQTGQPTTDAEYLAMGYVKDPKTQAWVLGGNTSTGTPPLAGANNTDFSQTRFAQQNAANNVNFYNQLRWDPARKKYVKIGQLIREGRLNEKTGRMSASKGGGGSGQAVQQVTAQEPQGTTSAPTTVLGLHLGGG